MADDRNEQMKQLIRDHYDAGVNNQDLDKLDAQLTDDFIDHAMPAETTRGPAGVKEWLARLKKGFPDLTVTIDEMIAEGDRVAIRATWTGTHTSEIFGMPPTGRIISFSGAVFWRIEGDRIAERWAYIDTAELMKRLRG